MHLTSSGLLEAIQHGAGLFIESAHSSLQHGAALSFWSLHAASFFSDVCILHMVIFSRLYVIVALLCEHN